MRRIPWLKIGAVAALWAIIVGAAGAGWMLGRGDAARQVSELRQRLAADTSSRPSCGIEVELLDAREPDKFPEIGPQGISANVLRAPGYLHLRQMLMR
jgi:hypothetical protein